jgi:hypothetical protein
VIEFEIPGTDAINQYLESLYFETKRGTIRYISADIAEGAELGMFTLRLTYRLTEAPKNDT